MNLIALVQGLTRRSEVLKGLVALVLFSTLVSAATVIAPRTAHACSCALQPLSEYADRVALAFAGRKVDQTVDGYEITQVFEVSLVYEGHAGRQILVPTYVPCELVVTGDEMTGIVAFIGSDGNLFLHLCGSAVGLGELRQVFGKGYPADLDAEVLRLEAEVLHREAEASHREAEASHRELEALRLHMEDLIKDAEVLHVRAETARLEAEALELRRDASPVVRFLSAGGAILVLVGGVLFVLRRKGAKV